MIEICCGERVKKIIYQEDSFILILVNLTLHMVVFIHDKPVL